MSFYSTFVFFIKPTNRVWKLVNDDFGLSKTLVRRLLCRTVWVDEPSHFVVSGVANSNCKYHQMGGGGVEVGGPFLRDPDKQTSRPSHEVTPMTLPASAFVFYFASSTSKFGCVHHNTIIVMQTHVPRQLWKMRTIEVKTYLILGRQIWSVDWSSYGCSRSCDPSIRDISQALPPTAQ